MSDPIQSSLAASTAMATTASGQAVTNPSTDVDTNTFLKLLIAQMKNQDPTNPTDSTQWMAQMAQFTTVEQITNLSKTDSMSQAVNLLGRQVTYASGSGKAQGTVQGVSSGVNGPTVTVDGVPGIALSAITDVADGSTAAGSSTGAA